MLIFLHLKKNCSHFLFFSLFFFLLSPSFHCRFGPQLLIHQKKFCFHSRQKQKRQNPVIVFSLPINCSFLSLRTHSFGTSNTRIFQITDPLLPLEQTTIYSVQQPPLDNPIDAFNQSLT